VLGRIAGDKSSLSLANTWCSFISVDSVGLVGDVTGLAAEAEAEAEAPTGAGSFESGLGLRLYLWTTQVKRASVSTN
jgi:hypothetical protein